MITIESSSRKGFFNVDGLSYQKNHFVIEYDNTQGTQEEMNFSLCNIATGNKIISSRGYSEITGINSWDELIELLNRLAVLSNSDVAVQDQTSDIVDYFLCLNVRALAVALNLTLDSYEITVVDGSLVTVGNYICLQENARAFQAKILSKLGNVLTMDTPLDYPFTVAAQINERSPNLNVNGALVIKVAEIKPISGVSWDITRILISMTHTAAADDGKFGGIPALTKGIVLRTKNGIHHTIFNAKTNGDLRERAYDLAFSDKAPAGTYGTSLRRSFAGQDKNGVTIRLNGDASESLQVIIQDDLTTLLSFRIIAQGHIVQY